MTTGRRAALIAALMVLPTIVAGIAAGAVIGAVAGSLDANAASAAPAAFVDDGTAAVLAMVNAVRSDAHLPPVALDPVASEADRLHACWMVANDQLVHDEPSGTPGYTVAGDRAAGRSNVGTSSNAASTDASFVDVWMSGPYHAIGILRPGLRTIGYGHCTDATGIVKSAAALDVLGGMVAQHIDAPILFPADGTTTTLKRFVTETPDPTINCPTTSNGFGLPLLAMLPDAPAASTSATLTGPTGPLPVCVITAANDRNADGRSLLGGDNAVSIIPLAPLQPGHHSVRLDAGTRVVEWSFDVAGPAPATPATVPTTGVIGERSQFVVDGPRRVVDSRIAGSPVRRLSPGVAQAVTLPAPPAGSVAVAITLTVTNSSGPGWVSAYPCSSGRGGTSTVNMASGATAANSTIVPLGSAGLCVISSVATDVIIDISGWFVSGDGATLVADASRVLDTRSTAALRPGETIEVSVAPPGTVAAVLGLVTTDVRQSGYVAVWSGSCTSLPPTSAGQATIGATTATPLITAVSPSGTVCVHTNAATQLIIDRQARFVAGDDGLSFVPLAPTRVLDSRAGSAIGSDGRHELALRVGILGTPSAMAAAQVVVTATDTTAAGWVAVVECSAGTMSNANTSVGATVAASAISGVSDGTACMRSFGVTDVVVDLTGGFVP